MRPWVYAVVYLLIRFNAGNIYAAFAIAIVFGTLMGLFNGFLIYHYNMPGIIITIATRSLFYGLLFVITRGYTISGFPKALIALGNDSIAGIPISIIIFIAVVVCSGSGTGEFPWGC